MQEDTDGWFCITLFYGGTVGLYTALDSFLLVVYSFRQVTDLEITAALVQVWSRTLSTYAQLFLCLDFNNNKQEEFGKFQGFLWTAPETL